VRLGEKHSVPTPIIKALYSVLKPWPTAQIAFGSVFREYRVSFQVLSEKPSFLSFNQKSIRSFLAFMFKNLVFKFHKFFSFAARTRFNMRQLEQFFDGHSFSQRFVYE